MKVLSKEPSARYRTADQLGRVLLRFGTQQDIPITPALNLTPEAATTYRQPDTVAQVPVAATVAAVPQRSQPRPEPAYASPGPEACLRRNRLDGSRAWPAGALDGWWSGPVLDIHIFSVQPSLSKVTVV